MFIFLWSSNVYILFYGPACVYILTTLTCGYVLMEQQCVYIIL